MNQYGLRMLFMMEIALKKGRKFYAIICLTRYVKTEYQENQNFIIIHGDCKEMIQINHYVGILTYDRIFKEIEYAAQLGVDIFVLDDGWEQAQGNWVLTLKGYLKD
ncbi:MAG: hypothetical protein H6613_02935 [Ignavibacteriales bacterium]|nr:hypothetical protein [Ignavibacteriales bacterium]